VGVGDVGAVPDILGGEGDSLTVHGSGLGLVLYTALGRMGETGCEGTEWESETSVRCLTSSGAMGTLRMAMTAGERSGSGSAMHSVDVGGLSVTGRSNGAGTGSASLTVHGSGLGLVLYTAMGRMGETGCEGTEWESETSVRCLTSSGSRGTRRVAMTAGDQGGSLTRVMSFGALVLSSSRRSNAAGTGSAFVTVHGAGLGHAALTGMMRAGQTGCEGTEWESETSVRCLVGHGSRGTRRVTLTAGELSGSMTDALSVDVTGIRVMGRGNAAGTGSAWVTVHGGGLGLQAHTGLVRIGETGCEGTEWESETSMRCLPSSGSRGTRRVVMTMDDRSGSGSAMYSVDVGGMSVTGRSNSIQTGSVAVTVHGGGLGSVLFTALGRMGATGCEGTTWESETSVRCLTSSGARGTLRVAMTAGERSGSGSAMYSVDVGGLSVTGRSNGAGTGSASLTVHGSGLGLVLYTAMGRMGETGCEGTEWESETSVRCLTSSGARGTLRMAMTAGERSGSGSAMHSVDVGGLSVTGRSNGAGTGSASLTVHGSGLGLVLYTAMGRIGETGCEGTEWESETSVRCLTSSGSRGTRRVAMTAGDQGGSLTRVMSFGALVLSASRRSNAAGTGSAFVTVHGAGLGHAALTGMMRAGQTGCEGTEWESETSVRCLVGHGSRGTRRVTLTAGELSGSMTDALSLDVTGMSVMGRGNAAGTGSAWVTVHGGGLGLQAHTGLVRIGETGCEGTEWESETSVRGLPSSGSRGTRRVVMTAGERSGSGSAMYSVDVGGMSVTGRSNSIQTGSVSVTVHGGGLGSVLFTALGRMGATGCEGTEWESETSVRCLTSSGARGTLRMAMTAGERSGSGSAMHSVDVGGLSVTGRSNGAGTGSASVTVHGSGLGLVLYTAMGRIGETGCEGSEWESETSVRCLTSSGSRGTRRVAMTAGDQGGSLTRVMSFGALVLSSSRRSNAARTGSAFVTVHGAGLGHAALTGMMRAGQTGCEGTEWESETSVRCLVGHGSRGTRRVTLTAGELSGSMTEALSVDVTGMSVMGRGNAAGTGSAWVTVHGGGLGLQAHTGLVRIGETGCEGTEWESETSVRCLPSSGARGTRRVVMTAGERSGSGSAMYSVDVGGMSVTGRPNGAGTGSASVTVHGSGLGLVLYSALGRMGATGCEGTEWESETSVRCLTSSGARGTLRVAMTAGERSGSGSAMHSVDVGGLSVTGRSNGAGTGSASVTVHGSGLGLVLYTAMGRMGETGCEGSDWESETSVRCLTSSGSRGTRRVAMTAGDQGGSLTRVMSFGALVLSSSRRSNAARTGSAFVTVHGAGLGHAALTGMMRAGQTGCEGTEWVSETSVRCLVGHGSRGTRRVTLTAGELSGSMTEALSVDVTGMSVMGRGNAAGTGSAWVTVHGGGLGLQAHTGLVRIGETGCEGTEWESETSVRCLTSSGSRETRRVVMTAGERSGSGSAMYSVDVGGMSVTGHQTVRGRGQRR
jgi:hypothetical protein